jgi:hypothetical protein
MSRALAQDMVGDGAQAARLPNAISSGSYGPGFYSSGVTGPGSYGPGSYGSGSYDPGLERPLVREPLLATLTQAGPPVVRAVRLDKGSVCLLHNSGRIS